MSRGPETQPERRVRMVAVCLWDEPNATPLAIFRDIKRAESWPKPPDQRVFYMPVDVVLGAGEVTLARMDGVLDAALARVAEHCDERMTLSRDHGRTEAWSIREFVEALRKELARVA